VGTLTPSGPVRVRVGDPIILECQSSGEPRPVVSWHRLGIGRKTLMSSPVPMESNAVLEVPGLLFGLDVTYIAYMEKGFLKWGLRVPLGVHGRIAGASWECTFNTKIKIKDKGVC